MALFVDTKMLATIMPHIQCWFADEQRSILNSGVPLSAAQNQDALLAGVRRPEQIRLQLVDQLRVHGARLMRKLAPDLELIRPNTVAMTFGYGIYLLRKHQEDRAAMVHHFVHVAQMEKLGGVKEYIDRYIRNCISFGYANAPLEIQARAVTARILKNARRVHVA
jgi:hypothetical protein